MEHPDPRDRPAGEGHQRDEQQEEGHQDVDGGGGALHSGLAAAPAVRCPEPDGSSDKHVGMTTTGLTLTWYCRYPYINIIWFCCHWLAMSNSSYNPFIYLLCNVSLIVYGGLH